MDSHRKRKREQGLYPSPVVAQYLKVTKGGEKLAKIRGIDTEMGKTLKKCGDLKTKR